MDDYSQRQQAKKDPSGFIAGLKQATIDEIQRVPELLLPIKKSVDESGDYGDFLLTGSSNVLTHPKVVERLIGRIETLRLLPLLQSEIFGTNPTFLDKLFDGNLINQRCDHPIVRKDLISMVLTGGYCDMLNRVSDKARQRWMKNYIESTLLHDVIDIIPIKHITELPRFVTYLVQFSAKLINYSTLGKHIGVSYKTAQHYISLLEQTFICTLIKPWHQNSLKQLVKTPKLHFFDSGLVANLKYLNHKKIITEPSLLGAMLETFVVSEVLKLINISQIKVKPYHFYQHQKHEVDLVLERADGKIAGIEVKATHSVSDKDFNGLKTLQQTNQDRFVYGVIVCDRSDVVIASDKLAAVPMSFLWQ